MCDSGVLSQRLYGVKVSLQWQEDLMFSFSSLNIYVKNKLRS